MRKEIAPEQFNYNKFPGPVFVSFDNIVKSDDIVLTLLDNYKNGFDATVFSQKFSELLLKYDYIVGDWGHEQLRLKGFYKTEKPVPRQYKFDFIEIYLKEYCQYGCAYFILENPEPRDLPKEEEGRVRRRRRRSQSGKQAKDKRDAKPFEPSPRPNKERRSSWKQKAKSKSRETHGKDHQGSKSHFVIRQK